MSYGVLVLCSRLSVVVKLRIKYLMFGWGTNENIDVITVYSLMSKITLETTNDPCLVTLIQTYLIISCTISLRYFLLIEWLYMQPVNSSACFTGRCSSLLLFSTYLAAFNNKFCTFTSSIILSFSVFGAEVNSCGWFWTFTSISMEKSIILASYSTTRI